MNMFLIVGIIWILLGLLGINNKLLNVPRNIKGTEAEKVYRRRSGIIFLVIGIAWIAVSLILLLIKVSIGILALLAIFLIASAPALILERKWKRKGN